MNLLEVADETYEDPFKSSSRTPEQDLANLAKREKALNHEWHIVTEEKIKLWHRIAGQTTGQTWNLQWPDDPKEQEAIEKMKQTHLPLTRKRTDGRTEIINWIPKIPHNEQLLPKIQYLVDREAKLSVMRNQIPGLVKKAKARLAAWKRKQPEYVSRKTGKELLSEIKKKLEDFIIDNQLGVTIDNYYYWAKNKMIVIELSVRIAAPGMSVNQTAKQSIKPYINQFLEDLGYTQFRFSERYIDPQLTILKIQLDDVEAKNKAAENEST